MYSCMLDVVSTFFLTIILPPASSHRFKDLKIQKKLSDRADVLTNIYFVSVLYYASNDYITNRNRRGKVQIYNNHNEKRFIPQHFHCCSIRIYKRFSFELPPPPLPPLPTTIGTRFRGITRSSHVYNI